MIQQTATPNTDRALALRAAATLTGSDADRRRHLHAVATLNVTERNAYRAHLAAGTVGAASVAALIGAAA